MTTNVMFPYACYTRGVNNNYLGCGGGGGGGTPGPPGPPGPPNPLSSITYNENLNETTPGDINLNLLSMQVTSNDPTLHPAMIFNSDIPSGGNFELGTPNAAFAGPGVGAGGASGAGENSVSQGNIWIISDDANSLDPKSYPVGGTLIFNFSELVNTIGIGLLNVADPGWTITLYDNLGGVINVVNPPQLGTNSYQYVAIEYTEVQKMEVYMAGIGGVTLISYERNNGSGTQYGYIQVIDNGTTNTILPTKTAGTYRINIESIVAGGASAIFDAAKASATYGGNLVRTASSSSITSEQLGIVWAPNQPIEIRHSQPKSPSTGATITYKYSITSII